MKSRSVTQEGIEEDPGNSKKLLVKEASVGNFHN